MLSEGGMHLELNNGISLNGLLMGCTSVRKIMVKLYQNLKNLVISQIVKLNFNGQWGLQHEQVYHMNKPASALSYMKSWMSDPKGITDMIFKTICSTFHAVPHISTVFILIL